MNPRLLGLVLLSVFIGSMPARAVEPTPQHHRMIVLTDIENEPDDTESMVRLMLYSNDIDLEGLIATTSTHLRTRVAPDSIRAVIRAYGKVRPNLLQHDPHYPAAEDLLALVKAGPAVYGMGAVGAGQRSEGSDWILRALAKDDARPLWISVWGGANTLAQALFTLRAEKSPAEVDRAVAKLRVYTISDQDDTGAWMRKNFPQLFYIVSPGGYGAATWTGMNQAVTGIDNTTISNKWLAEHIQQGHGPLGAVYPDVAYGMEGDTPSWLNLIPNGLTDPEHPNWGGWGGRYDLYVPDVANEDPKGFTGNVPIEPETRPIWTNAVDEYTPPAAGEYGRAVHAGEKSFRDYRATVWRWRDDFQNDFAARMLWTTKTAVETNHPPVVVLTGPETLTVRSGETVRLDASGTTDPDGDSLSYYWFQYVEAGTLPAVKLNNAENLKWAGFVAPKVDRPQTGHFIVRVTDKGTPRLSRYRRVVVTVTP